MKAFLLAAGRGARLRPFTDRLPKCLVTVDGRPLLFHWLQTLTDAGVSEVLVNTHYLPFLVEAAVASWRGSLTIRLAHEHQLLGSGGTLVANRRFVEHEHDFFVIDADNLTNVTLEPLLEAHRQADVTFTTYTCDASRPQPGGLRPLDQQSDRVDGFDAPSSNTGSNVVSRGIAVARHDIFEYLPPRSPLDLAQHVMPCLVGRMQLVRTTAYVRNIGSLADYYAAQAEWRRTRPQVLAR